MSVEYSLGGAFGPWVPIANALANTGAYAWTTPAFDSDSAQVRVTAYDPARNAGVGSSAGLFQLGSPTLGADNADPLTLALERPSPNPSSGVTHIAFSLPQAGAVRVEVYDISGRRVWSHEAALPAGSHSQSWNGRRNDGSHGGRRTLLRAARDALGHAGPTTGAAELSWRRRGIVNVSRTHSCHAKRARARQHLHESAEAIRPPGQCVAELGRERGKLEAAPGFEPGNKGFADPRLTTWLCRLPGFAGDEL